MSWARARSADELSLACSEIPQQRTVREWQEAERGRGLLLIDHLATRWGSRAVVDLPFCAGLGTVVWAEFILTTTSGEAAR